LRARNLARRQSARALARDAVLPAARADAASRHRAEPALQGARAVLPPASPDDPAALRRPLHAGRPPPESPRQADRAGDAGVGGAARRGPVDGGRRMPDALAGKRAGVVGAGFGGLALAIRLQSAGVATTLVEARDKPGGRAYFWERDGFTFDAGPTVITDPDCLRQLWDLTGHDMDKDVELMPVMPFYRLNWPDGTNFDYSNDEQALRREIAKLDPADIVGYDGFLEYSAEVHREGYLRLGSVPFLDFASMIRAAP